MYKVPTPHASLKQTMQTVNKSVQNSENGEALQTLQIQHFIQYVSHYFQHTHTHTQTHTIQCSEGEKMNTQWRLRSSWLAKYSKGKKQSTLRCLVNVVQATSQSNFNMYYEWPQKGCNSLPSQVALLTDSSGLQIDQHFSNILANKKNSKT